MTGWLFRARFNHVDMLGIAAYMTLLVTGHIALAVAIWVTCLFVSVVGESATKDTPETGIPS